MDYLLVFPQTVVRPRIAAVPRLRHFLLLVVVAVVVLPLTSSAQLTMIALDYTDLVLAKPQMNGELGIVVWDQREQVVDGRQSPSLLGYRRAPVGIAYPAMVKDHEPLAAVLAKKIVKAFSASGISCSSIPTTPKDDWQQVQARMESTTQNRFLVLKLHVFQFDGRGSSKYEANIEVEVYDRNMQRLASEHVFDNRDLGNANGLEWEARVTYNLKGIIESVVGRETIQQALSSTKEMTNQEDNAVVEPKTVVAHDVIITKDGNELEVTVSEITLETVKYRLSSQAQGPIRNIAKTDVFMIKYKDGTKEMFNQ